MRTNSRKPQKPLSFATARWAAYATASAATALGAATTAEADIHYSGLINFVFDRHVGTRQRDFPLDNGAALHFRQIGSAAGYFDYALFQVLAPIGGFRGLPAHQGAFKGYVEKLAAGEVVSQGPFRSGVLGALAQPSSYANPLSQWTEKGHGFIGFKFDTGAGPQYGFARVKVTGQPLNFFVVVDYSWGDVGDVVITTNPAEQATKVPASGSLGFLALGAAGLVAWRKRRQSGS